MGLPQDGRFAIIYGLLRHPRFVTLKEFAMTEVTILFLDDTFASTAIGPMEVFRHAGTLWNVLTGTRQGRAFA